MHIYAALSVCVRMGTGLVGLLDFSPLCKKNTDLSAQTKLSVINWRAREQVVSIQTRNFGCENLGLEAKR